MKPLGTITMYFPFVGEETRGILESIMDSAYNYSDFTHRLVERVVTEESSEELVHLAVIFTAFRDFHLFGDRNRYPDLVQPYFLMYEASSKDDPSIFAEALLAIDSILQTEPEDWIALQMHVLTAYISGAAGKRLTHRGQAIDKLEQLINENEELACFNALLLYLKAGQYARIDYREAARIMEQAYKSALEIDDLVLATQALNSTGVYLRNFDRPKALECAQKAENLAKQLGLRASEAGSLYIKAGVHSARGEFSASIDCTYAMMKSREKEGRAAIQDGAHSMAFLHNEMGESEDALEWSKMALESYRTGLWAAPYPYFDMARSLIGLGRLDEGKKYLEEGMKAALKLGDELLLQVAYFNEGLLEMAERRFEDAMLSFTKSVEICDRVERQQRLNSTLIAMTECEIMQFIPQDESRFDEHSGQWMERLEEEVEKKDIQGIRGRLLLLKAKLRYRQGREADAESLLIEVRRAAENPNVRYLADRVSELRAEIAHLRY
ncbi:MAG: tetratricopeptide repeat protein [Candidatus Thorarchaeota archaeon]|jgi:tetratricopeptide (TPR) repeat protein